MAGIIVCKSLIICIIFLQLLHANSVGSAQPNRTARPREVAISTTPSFIQEHPSRDEENPFHAKKMHPVSRLYLIRSTQKQMDPVFKNVAEKVFRNQKNHIIRREFQIEVRLDDKTASAWGQTKKDAKRKAAIAMLKQMNLQVDNGDS